MADARVWAKRSTEIVQALDQAERAEAALARSGPGGAGQRYTYQTSGKMMDLSLLDKQLTNVIASAKERYLSTVRLPLVHTDFSESIRATA